MKVLLSNKQVVIDKGNEAKINYLQEETGLTADFILNKILQMFFNSGKPIDKKTITKKLALMDFVYRMIISNNRMDKAYLKKIFIRLSGRDVVVDKRNLKFTSKLAPTS